MNKKAQGISINTIIIAAIALIVLVVLVAIFTGRLGGFAVGVSSCEDKGGTCKPYTTENPIDACISGSEAVLRGTNCERDPGFILPNKGACCIPLETK